MLNKAICQRCVDEWAEKQIIGRIGWHTRDEEAWEIGKVVCVLAGKDRGYASSYLSIHIVPKGCPYAVEHVVSEQEC